MISSRGWTFGVVLTVAFIATACGSTDDDTTVTSSGGDEPTTVEAALPEPTDQSQVVTNRGDASEGHTPTSFEGSGIGLFAGDNLNPGFPEGAGVQLFVSFDFSPVETVAGALVRSDVMTVSGDPFRSLGALLIEPVAYDSFGPSLWDLAASGPAASCVVEGGSGIVCDVTDAVRNVSDTGVAQFRIRFDNAADNDGQQDLATFFLTDSNANEPGIFTLEIDPR